MKIKNIGVFTSGGDAPGMNAAIRAVVRTAVHQQVNVFGIYKGYEGLINNDIKALNTFDVANIIQRGGTILKSARSKDFETKQGREKAFTNLKKHNIDGIIAIGGNGTYKGAKVFEEEFNVPIIGLPGTIDNDIYGTDSTIGADTALNNAIWAIDKIRDTAAAHDRVFFVEVMGRDSGFIGLNAGVAVGAESILIPEILNDTNLLLSHFEKQKKREKMFSIVIVTEGNKEGNAIELANTVRDKFPYLDIRVSVLGHMQRGGSPSAADRILASKLGYCAVNSMVAGESGFALGMIANKIAKTPFLEATKSFSCFDEELWEMAKILSL